MPKRYFIVAFVCFSAKTFVQMAYAEAPQPTQEFWEYMADFSDEKGNVIDPLELNQLANLKSPEDTKTELTDENDSTEEDDTNELDKHTVESAAASQESETLRPNKVKNDELEFGKNSSPAVSSAIGKQGGSGEKR